ncbi:MAG: PQQ-dependent sugar dehydrogenase, partial [Bacteroidota bacterium]
MKAKAHQASSRLQFMSFLKRAGGCVLLVLLLAPCSVADDRRAVLDLPANFENVVVIDNLEDPDALAFSPDGRLFICERITGRLLVAKRNLAANTWSVNAQPFYTFDIPKSGGVPERVRSAGLRGIAFDPNFASTGWVYAFYLDDTTRQNRVVRIQASTGNPDLADAGSLELLIDLPFNSSEASGSHNGGAIQFGGDGKLYITTGDGWTGSFAGDPVQSLTTYTGKVLRINPDGSIPTDNPFYAQTNGAYRAIYALGLRNPYTMAVHPDTGLLYVNEARGSKKDRIYIVEAGANYQHELSGGSPIGTLRTPWATAGDAGGELITGGAWYPASGGSFPSTYAGAYFVALWGSNSSSRGQVSYIRSNSDPTAVSFETNVGDTDSSGGAVKPVYASVGPDGCLFYLLTTYETDGGRIRRVCYTALPTVADPTFSPPGATYATGQSVTLSTTTAGAAIHYTTDFS